MFYEFHQNNSGGGFDFDSARGITTNVIIEANSADEANDKLVSIGGYFNGVGNYVEGDGYDSIYDGVDCPTCGDRWYAVSERDGQPVPSHYGKPLAISDEMQDLHGYGLAFKWQGDNPEYFIHYLDGRIVGCNG